MSRPKNPENVYSYLDAVTGVQIPTNPKQYNELLIRLDVTREEFDKGYVGQAGRKILAAQHLTPEQAVEKYGMDIKIARHLKQTVKTAPVVVQQDAPIVVEATTVEVLAPVVETEVLAETFYDVNAEVEQGEVVLA